MRPLRHFICSSTNPIVNTWRLLSSCRTHIPGSTLYTSSHLPTHPSPKDRLTPQATRRQTFGVFRQARNFGTNQKQKREERAKGKVVKKSGDFVFEGFGEDDDPFGVSRKPKAEMEDDMKSKKRGRIDLDYDMDRVEGLLDDQLDELKEKLGELRLGRPMMSTFDTVSVDLPRSKDSPDGETVPLSEISQIAIKSATLVNIRLFQAEHTNRVIAALRTSTKQWQPVDEGSGSIRIELPKTTKESRSKLVERAKQLQQEYIEAITEIEADTKVDIKATINVMDWGLREVKRLQNLVKPYHQDGKTAVQQKIKELSSD